MKNIIPLLIVFFLIVFLHSCVSIKQYQKLEERVVILENSFQDSDGDGVIDQIDQEPDTPEGFAVDTKGVQLDSDGDGISDVYDKEPFSPPGFNVNSDGIAQVPSPPPILDENDINRIIDSKLANYSSPSTDDGDYINWILEPIYFKSGQSDLSFDAYPILYKTSKIMKSYPDKRFVVKGFADQTSTKARNEQLSYDRAKIVIENLVQNYGIVHERLLLNYGGDNEPIVQQENSSYNRRVEIYEATIETQMDPPNNQNN